MSGHSGVFWDAIEGRAPIPCAAATLGLELIDADVERGTIELAFAATDNFTTPTGEVLGGFLAAMLYDTVGPALLATLVRGKICQSHPLPLAKVTALLQSRPGSRPAVLPSGA